MSFSRRGSNWFTILIHHQIVTEMPSVCADRGQDLKEERRVLWGDLDQLYPKGLEDPLLRKIELVEEVQRKALCSDVDPFSGEAVEERVGDEKEEEVTEGTKGKDRCYGCPAFRIASLVDLKVTWTPLACCPREVEVLPCSLSSTTMIAFVVETCCLMDVVVLSELHMKLSKNKPGSCPSMIAIIFSTHRQQILLVDVASISESESNTNHLKKLLEVNEVGNSMEGNYDIMISRSLQIGKDKLATHPGKLIVIQNTKKGFSSDAVNTFRSIAATHTIDVIQVSESGHARIAAGIEALVEDSGGIAAVVENRKELFDVLKYRTGVCGSLVFSLHAKLVLPFRLGLQELSGPGVRDKGIFEAGCHFEFNLLSVTDLDEYELCLRPQRIGKPPYGLEIEAPLQCMARYITVWGETVRQQTSWRLMDDDIFVHGRLSLASQLSEQRRAARSDRVRGVKSLAVQKLFHACTTLKVLLLWCSHAVQRAACRVGSFLPGFMKHFTMLWYGKFEPLPVAVFPEGRGTVSTSGSVACSHETGVRQMGLE